MSTKVLQEAIYQRICDGCGEVIADDDPDRIWVEVWSRVSVNQFHEGLDIHVRCAQSILAMVKSSQDRRK